MEINDKIMGTGLNYAVLDIPRGNLIKLGANKEILKAYHGYSELSAEELKVQYGTPPVLDYEYSIENARNHPNTFTCASYYEIIYGVLFCRLVDHQEKFTQINAVEIKNGEKVFRCIWADINWAIDNMYHQFDYNSVSRDNNNSVLKLVKFMLSIIIRQRRMKKILKRLRKQGKILFIISNSNYSFVNLTMILAFGLVSRTGQPLSLAAHALLRL